MVVGANPCVRPVPGRITHYASRLQVKGEHNDT